MSSKNKKHESKSKQNKHEKHEKANFDLEFAEDVYLEPKLKPSKTGSVSQNTAKPLSKHKKNKDK